MERHWAALLLVLLLLSGSSRLLPAPAKRVFYFDNEICSLLHQRNRDFSSCLIQGLLKAFFPGKSGDDLDSDMNSRAMKKRSTLKLVEDAQTNLTQTNLSLASFAHQGKHCLGLPKHGKEVYDELFMGLNVPVLPTFFEKAMSSFYDAAATILQSAAIMALTMNINAVISRRSCILVVLSLVLAASSNVQSVPAALPDIVALDFGESYNAFFDLMHTALEANTQAVRGHFILPPQFNMNDAQVRSRWISVEVTGDSDERVAVTYYRADNIYLVGFMNRGGTLYCTDDSVNIFPIEGCTRLGFTSNYHDLTGRPSKSLDLGLFMQEALLGREGAKEAANVLSEFGVTIFDQSAVKNAMLVYAITVAEAMRFRPIGDLVKANWEHSTVLPKELCNLPFVWQDLSILWCRGDEITVDEPEWKRAVERLGKAFIRNEQDVDMVLDLVKFEKDCRALVNP